MSTMLMYPSTQFFCKEREAEFEIKRLPNGSFQVRNGFFAMTFPKHSKIPDKYLHAAVSVEIKT